MTPDPSTVYRVNGQPALYVRTEDRPGNGLEHLFISVRGRVVYQTWVAEVPDEYELIIDAEGRRQANEAQWLLHVAEQETPFLLSLLRQACEWLPNQRANELRKRWMEHSCAQR